MTWTSRRSPLSAPWRLSNIEVKPCIHLRAETKTDEHRTPLTPADAARLVASGFDLKVERSDQRIFEDTEYSSQNCTLVEAGSWQDAPRDHYILGIKELPDADTPLVHHHIYFGHAYKQQSGWQGLLGRFRSGDGELLDLEYLTDNNGRRVAAFGYWAGYAGAAMAMKMWTHRQQNGNASNLGAQQAYANQEQLLTELGQELERLPTFARQPAAIVIGALGRCGRGARDLFAALDIEATAWDIEETARGGPFEELLEFDILVNTVLLSQPIPPFLTMQLVSRGSRRLGIISDVSCDPTSPGNPLPLYNRETTFIEPATRILDGDTPLDLTAVDHLPSMLPRESSEDFSEQLLPHLLTLAGGGDVWRRCREQFQHYSARV